MSGAAGRARTKGGTKTGTRQGEAEAGIRNGARKRSGNSGTLAVKVAVVRSGGAL